MKYKVVTSAFWHDGQRYKRGDIIESDVDLGTRVEPYAEDEVVKPKRKRRTKAEIEAEAALADIPTIGGDDEDQ